MDGIVLDDGEKTNEKSMNWYHVSHPQIIGPKRFLIDISVAVYILLCPFTRAPG